MARRAPRPTGSTPTGSSSRPGSSTSTPTSASPATRTPRRSRPGWPPRPTAASRPSARCRTRRRRSTSRACWRGSAPRRSASGSPVELLAHGAVTVGRAGERLAALGELADAGVVGFSDDGAPVRSASILRNALAYAGALGLPIVDHAEDPTLTDGAEANEGFVATVLGLRGWPAAAEAVGRRRATSRSSPTSCRDVPGARLHLTHLSTAGALDLVRRAKAAGLPVTCDVTPHHLALTDEWVAGARRWAWEAERATRGRTARSSPARTPRRCGSTRRSGRRRTRPPAWPRSSTARPTRSPPTTRPHTEVDKEVEFGLAANGISGIETALGRAARRGRRRAAAARAGDRGADRRVRPRVLGSRASRPGGSSGSSRARRPTSSSSIARSAGRSPPTRSRRGARTRRCSGGSWPAGSCSRSPAAGSPTRRLRPERSSVGDRENARHVDSRDVDGAGEVEDDFAVDAHGVASWPRTRIQGDRSEGPPATVTTTRLSHDDYPPSKTRPGFGPASGHAPRVPTMVLSSVMRPVSRPDRSTTATWTGWSAPTSLVSSTTTDPAGGHDGLPSDGTGDAE